MRVATGILLAGAGLTGAGVKAQEIPVYSQSTEYKQMIEELHGPAPSMAYIATGVRPEGDAKLQVRVDEVANGFRLRTGAAEFVYDKTARTLSWSGDSARNGGARWTASMDSCGEQVASAATRRGNVWTFSPGGSCGVSLEVMNEGLARLTVAGPARIHVEGSGNGGGNFFGLGERFLNASLAGTSLDVRPKDRAGEPGHDWVYVAVPLIYSPGGTGLYVDTVYDTQFRVNAADTSFDLQAAGSPSAIYLFAEDSPKAVLTAYTGLTGRPGEPPLWTFGPWITALNGRGSAIGTAERIRHADIPASALWVFDLIDEPSNLGWPFWYGSYYGKSKEFTDTLHGMGFRVLDYVHPYVRAQMSPYTNPSENYAKGVAGKLFVVGADGQPAGPRFEDTHTGNVDFSNPRAVDWWQGMIASAVRDQGFDGWMEDFGEWVRDSDQLAAGDGAKLSEVYPLLYHKATLRIADALNPEVVPFVRSGSAGSQGLNEVLWGGDQWSDWDKEYGLPSVVTAGITAGMSGFSMWGPDILSSAPSKELFLRWVEFGALTPVMRDHPWDKPAGSYNLFTDSDTTAAFRRWAQFHSSLLPYFVTYEAEAHRTGVPIMRHTVLEFPGDPRAATAEYQYFLGDEMLVAPVISGGGVQRTLYLPKGEWVNFWSGGFLQGGQDVTVNSPIGEPPIMVRAGSVIPFKPERETGSWDWSDRHLLDGSLVWHIYLKQDGSAERTFTLPNGTSAHLVQQGNHVALEGKSKTVRDYEVVVRSMYEPTGVMLNGVPLPKYRKASSGNPVQQWWWANAEAHFVFRAADFKLELKAATVGY